MFNVFRCCFEYEWFETLECGGFKTEEEAEKFADECERCIPFSGMYFFVKEED